ncbi:MAG: DUF47 domain-containing protein [Syntrophomonadaceae bacterium]|nr:DUF47 domain-containing protein [Syntrophomonadaceae bacterium]
MGIKLKPQDERFFEYFEDSTEAISEAAHILKAFFEDRSDPAMNLERINEVEHHGDRIFLKTIERINHSFITPFDREDILLLAQDLNRVLDHIQGTMEKVVIYKVGQPKERYVLDLVNVLVEATEEVKFAVRKLRELRVHHREIIESCEKIRAFEHQGDNLYRTGIASLFENTEDVIEIIKWKEIYEHLETTLDYCETVSNVIKGIAVKYV